MPRALPPAGGPWNWPGWFTPIERCVVLLSGGASALLALPAAGLTLAEKMATTRTVMEAGIAIDGLNCVENISPPSRADSWVRPPDGS